MQFKQKVAGVLLLLVAGQANAQSPSDEAPASRLRLFGQNGVGMVLYTNTTCTAEYAQKIRASGSLGSAFGSMLGKVKNESLGIAETDTSRGLKQRGMILSKAYFKEYPLVPGQPVVVEAGMGSPTGWRCDRLISSVFTPEAGKDYEVALDVDFSGGVCTLKVNQVAADGTLLRLPVQPAGKHCGVPADQPGQGPEAGGQPT